MAAIPTFTGDGGPILSLTGEQCTEYALFWGDNSDGCSLPRSSESQTLKRLQKHEKRRDEAP
jgi:hypothetical protein